jgi:hypothetical protein
MFGGLCVPTRRTSGRWTSPDDQCGRWSTSLRAASRPTTSSDARFGTKAVSDAIHGANDAVHRPAILEDPPAETLGIGDAAESEGAGVVEIIEDVVVFTIL